MTIIAARRYRAGKIVAEQVPVDGTGLPGMEAGEFDWIGVANPDAAEMELLSRQYGLHPLAIEDALNPSQMPKIDNYGDALFIAARTAALDGGDTISYGQTALFLSRNYLVTVRFGSERAHSSLRRRLELDSHRLAEGPDYVAHAILDFIVDGYSPIIDSFEDAAQRIEEHAIDTFPDRARSAGYSVCVASFAVSSGFVARWKRCASASRSPTVLLSIRARACGFATCSITCSAQWDAFGDFVKRSTLLSRRQACWNSTGRAR